MEAIANFSLPMQIALGLITLLACVGILFISGFLIFLFLEWITEQPWLSKKLYKSNRNKQCAAGSHRSLYIPTPLVCWEDIVDEGEYRCTNCGCLLSVVISGYIYELNRKRVPVKQHWNPIIR